MNKLFILAIYVLLFSLIVNGGSTYRGMFKSSGDDALTEGDDNKPKQSNGDDNNRPYYGDDNNKHSYVDTYNNKPSHGDDIVTITVNRPSFGDDKSSYGDNRLSYGHDKSAYSNDNPSYGDQSNDNPTYGNKGYDNHLLEYGNDNIAMNENIVKKEFPTFYRKPSLQNNKIYVEDKIAMTENIVKDDLPTFYRKPLLQNNKIYVEDVLNFGNDKLSIENEDFILPGGSTDRFLYGNNLLSIKDDYAVRLGDKLSINDVVRLVKGYKHPMMYVKPSLSNDKIFVEDVLSYGNDKLSIANDNLFIDDVLSYHNNDKLMVDDVILSENDLLSIKDNNLVRYGPGDRRAINNNLSLVKGYKLPMYLKPSFGYEKLRS